jgi:heme/copper-type cytochrome/quinol oxidase subunit 3
VSAPHAPHDDHGHDHGSPFIQHHYDDGAHQFDSGKLGIWLFLAQEVLFFSALFVAYILYRHHHPEIFAYAHHWLDVKYGAINTAVLIFSSFTAAYAVRAAQLNQRKLLILCLATTILCACGFLGIKMIEYTHKIKEHVLFGKLFDPCVSSGGNELLTMRNECAGTKTTIKWDFGTELPKPGSCFNKDYDQDPVQIGVQLSCKVAEVTQEKHVVHEKVKDPKTGEESIKDTTTVKEVGRKAIEQCEDEPNEDGEIRFEIHPKRYPCWIQSVQPAVCKADAGIIVMYGDEEKREEEVESDSEHETVSKYLDIDGDCAKAPKIVAAPDQLADVDQRIIEGKRTVNQAPVELTNHQLGEQFAAGPPPEHTGMFLTIYFAMTGLHGIHVLVGVFVFIWLLRRAIRGDFDENYFGPIDYAALYWHIVDLIWIFLFPLLYLIH